MKIPTHPTLIRRMRDGRLKELAQPKPLLGASLVRIKRRCGRPGCHCQRGQKHEGFYVTLKREGKTKTVYVPKDLVAEVRSWIEQNRRMKRLMREITDLNLALIRSHVTFRTLRRGRS